MSDSTFSVFCCRLIGEEIPDRHAVAVGVEAEEFEGSAAGWWRTEFHSGRRIASKLERYLANTTTQRTVAKRPGAMVPGSMVMW